MGNQSTMVCSSKQSPALGQEYHITCIPGLSAAPKDQVPQGAALPHGVTGAPPAQPHTPAGPGALPHHGQQQGRALTARGAQHRANSDPHSVLETALTTAPSQQQPDHRGNAAEHGWKGCFYSQPWSCTSLPQPSKAHACSHTAYF